MTIPPVCKQLIVDAPVEKAFRVFVAGAWWPKDHSILPSGSPRKELTMEQRPDGRWYETGEDGTQCDWGKVLVWEPPQRLVLAWHLNERFEYDPGSATEVEIKFIPKDGKTLVELEHRGFDARKGAGQNLRDAVDGKNGWGDLLRVMGAGAEA
jgi:uncharacterized protein YndB with AHSA1/START domain